MEFYKCQEKKDVYSTWCSQAVTHLSTNHARRCLTSVIGREPVFSTWYGRRHRLDFRMGYILKSCHVSKQVFIFCIIPFVLHKETTR